MIAIDIDGEFIPNLLKQIATIPGVVQVRCNRPLRKKYRDIIGEDGVFISAFVQRKDGSDFYIRFEDYYTHAEANDPSKHEEIIATIKKEVDDYLVNDISPINLYGESYVKKSGDVIFQSLIERMEKIPGVLQVRYHHPLKKQYVDKIGADGYIITTYIANKDKEDFFLPFITMAPKAVCYNEDKHASLIDHLQGRIEDYTERDVVPPRSVSIEEMQILQV